MISVDFSFWHLNRTRFWNWQYPFPDLAFPLPSGETLGSSQSRTVSFSRLGELCRKWRSNQMLSRKSHSSSNKVLKFSSIGNSIGPTTGLTVLRVALLTICTSLNVPSSYQKSFKVSFSRLGSFCSNLPRALNLFTSCLLSKQPMRDKVRKLSNTGDLSNSSCRIAWNREMETKLRPWSA